MVRASTATHNAMDILLTHLRHQLTFFASLGTILLGWHLLAPDQVAAVNAAGAELVKPLSIIAGSVGVFLGRFALAWLGKLISHGSGENSSSSGWMGLLLVASTMVALAGLPSCSPSLVNVARAIPLKICASYHSVEVCASSAK